MKITCDPMSAVLLNPIFILLAGLILMLPSITKAQLIRQEMKEGTLVMEGQDSVLFYQASPRNHNGAYVRNHYIHPLWNVNGQVLTEDFPPDHLHQRGIFWAWHQILIDGKRIGDGWALEHFTQKVLSTGWEVNDDGSATLTTKVIWQSDLYLKNGKPVPYILESTDITIHPKAENFRKIDFVIQLEALDRPVAIGGSEDVKGYSGFSVRMKLPDDVRFSGPDGIIQPQNTAVQSAGFVKVTGTFEDHQPSGIIILDDTGNPDYPQSWILRSQKSMQNVAWPGRNPITIKPGKPLVLKYSVIPFVGETVQGWK